MTADDRSLLNKYAATGDADCFAELIERHRDMVYSTTARLLPDAADAEDATQEAFLRLAHSARQVRTSVSAWLHRTAVNAAVDALRKDGSRRAREREASAMAANEQQEASWDDLKDQIDLAIDGLPDDLRQPVVLCYLKGKTQVAAAEDLGIGQTTVSARAKKGIEQVRERLKKSGIAVSAVALASLLTENAVQAAPASVAASLAKLAVAGIKPVAPAGWLAALGATIAGSVAAKVTIGVLAVCAIGVTAYQVTRGRPTERPRTASSDTGRDTPAGGRRDASDDQDRSAGPGGDDLAMIAAYTWAIADDAGPRRRLGIDGTMVRDLLVAFSDLRAKHSGALEAALASGDAAASAETTATWRAETEALLEETLTAEQYEGVLAAARQHAAE